MSTATATKNFGAIVSALLAGEDQPRDQMRALFDRVLNNEETDMHQGAFLAALAAKGETAEEIAAAWEAIYELDTTKVAPVVASELCENSGTGMDAVKTFNISSVAAIVAATLGVPMARHGSRAITSRCGTVDLIEALGVDVEVEPQVVADSIEACGIGLFNGMSPLVHPRALGRILSQISFGTILNIAASLANPARPTLGVRGVNRPEMVEPVAHIMAEVGYRRALVLHGLQADGSAGIDEASTLGNTRYAELAADGTVTTGEFSPAEFDLAVATPDQLATSGDLETEARRVVALLQGRGTSAQADIVALNTAPILYVAGKAESLASGVRQARDAIAGGGSFDKLREWVATQSLAADNGLATLDGLVTK